MDVTISWFETAQEAPPHHEDFVLLLGAATGDAKACGYFISDSRAA
jgi:hypothetical protein